MQSHSVHPSPFAEARLLEFWVQMFIICAQKSPETTHSSLFGGVGGVCMFLEIEFGFGKLLGEIEFEFLRNLKYLVVFEVRA